MELNNLDIIAEVLGCWLVRFEGDSTLHFYKPDTGLISFCGKDISRTKIIFPVAYRFNVSNEQFTGCAKCLNKIDSHVIWSREKQIKEEDVL